MSNVLVILSTHTGQLTSPFRISQLSINPDESSFKHFIEHLVGVRENSKFQAKKVRSRLKQNQLVIIKHKSQPKIKSLCTTLTLKNKQSNNKITNKPIEKHEI